MAGRELPESLAGGGRIPRSVTPDAWTLTTDPAWTPLSREESSGSMDAPKGSTGSLAGLGGASLSLSLSIYIYTYPYLNMYVY